jgi:hydroxypyruvate reductase
MPIPPETFLTHSLTDLRLAQVLAAALHAVEPGAAVIRHLRMRPLPPARRIYALGLGKAALPMTQALAQCYPLRDALIITKHPGEPGFSPATLLTGGHPVPNADSVRAGQAALSFVSGLGAEDVLVCLISGGGSALMSAPRVPLEDLQTLTRLLLACGARIDEINTLRRHLDEVKGGGLARQTQAKVRSLILSDVVGNPLEAIASGPTAPDPSTRAQAWDTLKKYDLLPAAPPSVLQVLQNAEETPKADDPLFARVENALVGSNALAAEAALRQAQSLGFSPLFLGDDWQGEAREAALRFCHAGLGTATSLPLCVAAGGETTVTLRGEGKGGRNLEFALAAVTELAGQEGVTLVTLATDGEDGVTGAAGAVVTGETLARARLMGLDPADFLARNDSYTFFAALGDALKTGATGTNVNDLAFLFRA